MKGSRNVAGLADNEHFFYKTGCDFPRKRSIYVYPITPYTYQPGSNDYILRVRDLLDEDFHVVNKVTRLGIFDILFKLHKCDIIYFNWIADLADKRLGYIQVTVLFFILVVSRLFGIKIAWFIHNDLSHSRTNLWLKKIIRKMMIAFTDITLTHTHEFSFSSRINSLNVFEHPFEPVHPIEDAPAFEYDVLIWGSVSPYKGILDFVQYNHASNALDNLRILITGKDRRMVRGRPFLSLVSTP